MFTLAICVRRVAMQITYRRFNDSMCYFYRINELLKKKKNINNKTINRIIVQYSRGCRWKCLFNYLPKYKIYFNKKKVVFRNKLKPY